MYSSVGVVTRLQNIRSGVRISAGTRDVSLLKCADQLWNPPSFPCSGYWGCFSGKQHPKRDLNHLFPTGTEVKNEWSYTSTPPYVSVARTEKNVTFYVVFNNTASNQRVGSVKEQDDCWVGNRVPIWACVPVFTCSDWKKPLKISISSSSVLAELWTSHKRLETYFCYLMLVARYNRTGIWLG